MKKIEDCPLKNQADGQPTQRSLGFYLTILNHIIEKFSQRSCVRTLRKMLNAFEKNSFFCFNLVAYLATVSQIMNFDD